ncbi:MAG: tail fiber domain-containing protein [Coprobacillus sp.]
MNIKIYCDDIDISDYIKDIKSSIEFTSNTLIGNASSNLFTISLNNKSRYFDDKLDKVFKVYKDDVEYAKLTVYERPETVFENLSLVLYDDLVKTNIKYDTNTQMYPCTLKEQLEEMSSLCKVPIDYTQLPTAALERTINTYDSEEMIRTHLCWIAETYSCNVFCNSEGIYFERVSKNAKHNIENDDYVYSFQTANKFKCTMVVCELKNLYKGDETGNLIKLDDNNPYITSQEHIDYIFNQIGGITFTSIKDLKMRAIEGLNLANIVHYKDYFDLFATKIEVVYHNGELSHNTTTISGEINSSNKSKYLGGNNLSSKVKRLQFEVDDHEQSLQIISKQQDKNVKDIGSLKISVDSIQTEVSKTTESIYKFETGSGNIFENCNQFISKNKGEEGETISSDMPLGINKDYIRGKDICIAVDVKVINAQLNSSLGNYVGAEFSVGYADGTKKTYSTRWHLGQFTLQYLLTTATNDCEKRIYEHFKIDDKEITSVSNLKIIISLDADKAVVSYPKVEFGEYPTGYVFDVPYIRDNVQNIQKDYTAIKQDVSTLSLQSVSMQQEITTIKGDTTTLTTRLNSAEIRLQPTNILLAVNEQIGANGKLYSTKFILDLLGVHISGGGLDISNNAGTKVLYADTSGNLVINNLRAVNGSFSGNISGSSITGNTNINVGTDLIVGNNIYLSPASPGTTKGIYLNSNNYLGFNGSSQLRLVSHNCTSINAGTTSLPQDYSSMSVFKDSAHMQVVDGNQQTYIQMQQGNIWASNNIVISSDIRLKNNICYLDENWIDELNVVVFDYNNGAKNQIGLIANDYINKEFSKYFLNKNKDEYYAINYSNINNALIKYCQQIRKDLNNACTEIATLKARIGGIA